MGYRYAVKQYDHWLEPWLAQCGVSTGVALDVGCGPGLDTQFLATRGFEVQACDLSEEALRYSRTLNPAVPHEIANARDLAPYPDSRFDLLVAGLSLHYFDRQDSHRAFEAAHRVLKPGGLFLFRLNAWDDYQSGAPEVFKEWQVVEFPDGNRKQFFSEAMIRELAADRFELVSLEKKRSVRYEKPKSFFEGCARKPRVA